MGDIIAMANSLPMKADDVFNTDALAGDLYDNVRTGFAVISFRGGKWRIKQGGEETLITNADGDPIPALECVIVKANPNVSKIYYEKSYAEGDDSAPTCWSINGKTPDAGVENPVSSACATCPNNAFGSRISPNGNKAKACSDSRRLAVVPVGDILNEQYGGPMLMRVPAASLKDLTAYGKGMAAKNFPYNAIATRIGFDPNVAYPKLTFKPMKPLNEEEKAKVVVVANSETIHAILEGDEHVAVAAAPAPAPQQAAVSLEFDDPEPTPVEQPKTKKKAAPVETASTPDPVEAKPASDDDLENLLADL